MLTAPTRNLLELVIYHTNDIGAEADMSWSSSDPVICDWMTLDNTGVDESQLTMGPDTRVRLRCSRDSFNTAPMHEPDFVNVIRQNGGDATINIPWSKYNEQGEPVETLEEIRRQLEKGLAAARRENAELRSTLEDFRVLERLPLRQQIGAHPGMWGTWREEYTCPERQYVCGGTVAMTQR